MAGHPVLRATWTLAVAAAAFLAAGAVGFFSFALGLLIADPMLLLVGRPVAALVTGLAGALAAAWTANLLAPDRSRTRLGPVLAWSLLAAAAGLAVFYAMTLWDEGAGGPYGIPLAVVVVLVAVGAALGALRKRRPQGPLRRDAWTSLGLLMLIPLAIYGAIGLACLFDMCGA